MPEMAASVTFGASSFDGRLLGFGDGAKYVMFSIVFCSLSPVVQEIIWFDAHSLRHRVAPCAPPTRPRGRRSTLPRTWEVRTPLIFIKKYESGFGSSLYRFGWAV